MCTMISRDPSENGEGGRRPQELRGGGHLKHLAVAERVRDDDGRAGSAVGVEAAPALAGR
jgi:hypothetical protein